MSFKSLVQSLFKLTGSQAMPNVSVQGQSVTSGQTFVCPFDGYASLQVDSSDYTLRYARISSDVLNSSNFATGQTSSGMQAARNYIPVRKGVQIEVVFSESATAKVYFINTVGAS